MKVMHRYNSEERQHFLLSQQYSFKLKPRLLYSGILSKQKGWKDNMHTHDFAEVLFVLSGKGYIYYNGSKRDIKAGDIVIYNANIPHREQGSPEDPLELLFVALDKVEITNLDANCLIPPNYDIIYPSGDMEEIFQQYFSNIVDEMARKDKFYVEIAKNATITLVMYLYRLINRFEASMDVSQSNGTLDHVLDYIDKHYLEPITLDQIAEACYINKYYLSHMFSDSKQMTVGQYILGKRMEEAKRLLATTNLTVNEIALNSGFNDQGYFSRAFKKALQMTPLQYRKSETSKMEWH